jgi:hypothetical protein
MNELSRDMLEEAIGIQMAALARSEGHRSIMPNTDKRISEKCSIERTANNRQKEIALQNQQLCFEAIEKGHMTVKQIVKATGLGDESVRKACRRLYEADRVKRSGILSVSGGQAYVYKLP